MRRFRPAAQVTPGMRIVTNQPTGVGVVTLVEPAEEDKLLIVATHEGGKLWMTEEFELVEVPTAFLLVPRTAPVEVAPDRD